jgi:tetratricopeptide (TPR) repeat protein
MVQSFKPSWVTIRRVLPLLAVLLVAGCGSPEERAQRYYERGIKLLAQHDDAKASIEFKNALQLKKDMLGAWRGLAEIEERNQNRGSLIGIQRTIVELDPKDVGAKVRLARLLFLANGMDDALNVVKAAGELDERNASVLGLRAMILYRGDRKAAVRAAQAALEIEPANAEATAVIAADRLALGDVEGASLILDRESAAQEMDIGIQLFKIKIFEQMKNLEQVESVFQKLIEHYPKEPAFRRALVKFYLDQKRPDDAEKELRALAAANPADVALEMDAMRLLRITRGPTAARQELEARIKAGGQTSAYQIASAEFDFAQGNVTDSFSLLKNLGGTADSRETALAAKVKLAEFYFTTKKLDEAEALVSQILREDSRNTSGLKLRAEILMVHGQFDGAIAGLREALNDYPRSTELMQLLAAAYEQSGSIELADKQYADAIKVSGFNAAVGLNYVAFLGRRGSIEHAEGILTELASRSPNNIAVLSTLAEVRLAKQNWIATQEIADTIRRVGNDGLADQILAAALIGQNKYNEGVTVLEKAYAAAPGATQPMVALVNALVRAQGYDKAVSFLQTVLKSNPTDAEAYVMLGSVQLQKNAPTEALESFRKAVEKQPKNANGYQALADFYVRENNNGEALKILRTGLQQQPDSFALHMALGGILERKGDYEAAITEYEHLLKQQPGSLAVANGLASLLSDHRTDKASLERAYSLAMVLRKSPVSMYKDTLGWVYYQHGDYKNAVPLLEEAAAERPDSGVIQYHLGMSYIAIDQPAKASERLNKARALATNNGELEQKIKAAVGKVSVK